MEDDFTNFRIGSWCSDYPPKQGEWLKIDLGRSRKVTAVATQGRCTIFVRFARNLISKPWGIRVRGAIGNDPAFQGKCTLWRTTQSVTRLK